MILYQILEVESKNKKRRKTMSVEDSIGYQCEFLDSVPDDFYCIRCSQVARRLAFTSCCGESYCLDCIQVPSHLSDSPCPACGEKGFQVYEQVKYQKRLRGLQVYCSMKERGCDWSGPLEELDTHLDPDQDNCQYVDTKCPLNCHLAIPKNKVEQHVKSECVKRDHTCQYCAFKATYEEIMSRHWSECIYLPLKCPNDCGVTSERHFMDDHLSVCRLQEISCAFSSFGCDERFNREDQEEHVRANIQSHLSLLGEGSIKTHRQLDDKLQEQEERLKEQEQRIREQESKLLEQEQQMKEQECRFLEMLREQNKTVSMMQQKLKQYEQSASIINVLNRSFVIEDFSKEKARNRPSEWKSPPMYTHLNGYKFCIGIDANGNGESLGKAMRMELWPLKSPNDYRLKWPATVRFVIKLMNEQKGEVLKYSTRKTWWKPNNEETYYNFERIKCGSSHAFITHSDLKRYLCNDSLYFSISEVNVEHN